MAKTATPPRKPRKPTPAPAVIASTPDTLMSQSIKTVGELLKNPLVRNVIGAGVATAVASRTAKKSARKAAREEVQGLGVEGGVASPKAIIGSAVASVATEAVRRLMTKGTKKPTVASAVTKSDAGASASKAKPKTKAVSKGSGKSAAGGAKRTAPNRKAGTSGGGKQSNPPVPKAPNTRSRTKNEPRRKPQAS